MRDDDDDMPSIKRLEQSRRMEIIQRGPGVWGASEEGNKASEGNSGQYVSEVEGPGEDGTYGASDSYIYCHTTDDAYVQWNGKYLYSTLPFDLSVHPLVIAQSQDANAVHGQ